MGQGLVRPGHPARCPHPEGNRLLPIVRRVLSAHAQLSEELDHTQVSGNTRPLIVDVALHGSTGPPVLAAAREAAPDLEFVPRFHSGLARAAAEIADGRLDVSFGRIAGLPPTVRDGLEHQLIRYDQLAVHLPPGHRLTALPQVPLAALAGETVYAAAGNEDTTEWTDYARTLFAGRGINLAPPSRRSRAKLNSDESWTSTAGLFWPTSTFPTFLRWTCAR